MKLKSILIIVSIIIVILFWIIVISFVVKERVSFPESGIVVDSLTGEPIEGIKVTKVLTYRAQGWEGRSTYYKRVSKTTNKKGKFHFGFINIFPIHRILDDGIEININLNQSKKNNGYSYIDIDYYQNYQDKNNKKIIRLPPLVNSIDKCGTDELCKKSNYLRVAIITLNENLCEFLNYNDLFYCYKYIAIVKKDKSICKDKECEEKVENIIESLTDFPECFEKENECYPNDNTNLKIKTKNLHELYYSNICSSLPKLDKAFCFFYIAQKTNNKVYCRSADYSWYTSPFYNPYSESDLNYYNLFYNSKRYKVSLESNKVSLASKCTRTLAMHNLDDSLCYDNQICKSQIEKLKNKNYTMQSENMKLLYEMEPGALSDNLIRVYKNEGPDYVNSSDYGCYLPGVVLPGEQCLVNVKEEATT
jgi:hypothetical protein